MVQLRLGSALMTLGGVGFVVCGILSFARHLAGGHSIVTMTHAAASGTAGVNANVSSYLGDLSLAVCGFVTAMGLAVAALSWFGVQRGDMWAWSAAVFAPLLGVAVSLPTRHTWWTMESGHLWLIIVNSGLIATGAVLALRALRPRVRDLS